MTAQKCVNKKSATHPKNEKHDPTQHRRGRGRPRKNERLDNTGESRAVEKKNTPDIE